MGIINYVKELEDIGRDSTGFNNDDNTNDDRQSSIRSTGKDTQWTGRDLNPRPPPCEGDDLPADLPAPKLLGCEIKKRYLIILMSYENLILDALSASTTGSFSPIINFSRLPPPVLI